MITINQVRELSKKLQVSDSVVFREFLQLYILSRLYSTGSSEDIFFKGGTAIHLIYKAPRFSEDLDFTVGVSENKFEKIIKEIFQKIESEIPVNFKEKKVITGKSFLATANFPDIKYQVFVKLDFSFREVCRDPQKSIIETDFPILFNSYVYHLSDKEIFSEKIRAILSRDKGRDVYDLWFLLNRGVRADDSLIKDKLNYYKIHGNYKRQVLKKIENYSKESFVLDLRPFVSKNDREKLPHFFEYVRDYIISKL